VVSCRAEVIQLAAVVTLTMECDREDCDTFQTLRVECEAVGWVQYSELGCDHPLDVPHDEAEDEGMKVFCSRDCLLFYLAGLPPITQVEV